MNEKNKEYSDEELNGISLGGLLDDLNTSEVTMLEDIRDRMKETAFQIQHSINVRKKHIKKMEGIDPEEEFFKKLDKKAEDLSDEGKEHVRRMKEENREFVAADAKMRYKMYMTSKHQEVDFYKKELEQVNEYITKLNVIVKRYDDRTG